MPGKDSAANSNEQPLPGAELTLSKMDAARRQLVTGIELWFKGGDPVSIHTLVYAAYEIIHAVSKKRGRTTPLLFDTHLVKDKFRGDWNKTIKKHANFFKHANNDPDADIGFNPKLSEAYILFCLLGLVTAGIQMSDRESAFFWWTVFDKPEFLTDRGREMLADRLDTEQLALPAGFSKADFFEQFLKARQILP